MKYKENLNDHKSEEFIKVVTELRRKLQKLNDTDRLDIIMHMLLSNGIIDTINFKKDFRIDKEDYVDLTKDDYIQTTKNILSELDFYEYEMNSLTH
tara:strand:- start:3462 stop:3749 length:288 start_codon:yes stop_codon:yes gene_type:complete